MQSFTQPFLQLFLQSFLQLFLQLFLGRVSRRAKAFGSLRENIISEPSEVPQTRKV